MSGGILKYLDLALVVFATLLCIMFVLVPPLNETPTRMILGIPLVLFLPGYSLISALFPRNGDLDWIERVTLGFGMSIMISPLFGLALNYTSFGIRLTPVLIILSVFTISLSILSWVRRMRLQAEQRFRFTFKSLLKVKSLFLGQSVIDRILSLVLVASIIASCVALVCVVVTPKTGERFTEFYILGPNGKASDYPTNLKLGEEGEVIIIGIVNHEYENLTYRLEVKFNGNVIHKEYVLLVNNQTLEVPFRFVGTKIGEDQKLEFLLYMGEEKEPYRTLHLWIDVG